MRELNARRVEEYANAQHAHPVLTEDVKFLDTADRERVLDKEREVVRGFAQVVGALRPDLQQAAMSKPLTMLLFGMINWLFTWMKPQGRLDYEAMAPLVADLFLGGLGAFLALPCTKARRDHRDSKQEGQRENRHHRALGPLRQEPWQWRGGSDEQEPKQPMNAI